MATQAHVKERPAHNAPITVRPSLEAVNKGLETSQAVRVHDA